MALPFEFIASISVTSSVSQIEFTNIPNTYTDLYVTLSARSDRVANNAVMYINFNSNGNHEHERLYGGGGSGLVGASRSGEAGITNGTTNIASSFSSHAYYILNYSGSEKKLFVAETAQASNSNSANVYTYLLAGQNSTVTAAISSIKFYIEETRNFVQYSTATLYGIKNS